MYILSMLPGRDLNLAVAKKSGRGWPPGFPETCVYLMCEATGLRYHVLKEHKGRIEKNGLKSYF